MTMMTRSRMTVRRPLRSRPRGFYGLGTGSPETEWHIAVGGVHGWQMPTWIDPLFVFQKTWNPDAVVALEGFKPMLGKVFAILGAGLAGYWINEKYGNTAYTVLAGAGGAVAAPLLLSGYARFTRPTAAEAVDDANTASADAVQAQAEADASGHPADQAAADQAAVVADQAAAEANQIIADSPPKLVAYIAPIQRMMTVAKPAPSEGPF